MDDPSGREPPSGLSQAGARAAQGWAALAGRLAPAGRSPSSPNSSQGGAPTKRLVWLGGAGAAVVALIALAVWGAAAASAQAAQPGRTASRYCDAVLHQRYTDVYALLSAQARGDQTAAQFASEAQLHDTIDGRVTTCQAGDAAAGLLGAVRFAVSAPHQASVPLTLTRARLGAHSGRLTLARQGQGWGVVGVSAALEGTTIAPLRVADQFCQALARGDYRAAFAALSTHQQQSEKSLQQFTAEATQPAGATFAGCTPNYQTYKVVGQTATLQLSINIQVAAPSGTPVVPIAASATLVQQAGAWKLDGLDLVART